MPARITLHQSGDNLVLAAPWVELEFSDATGEWLTFRNVRQGLEMAVSAKGESQVELLVNGQEHRPPPRREPYYTDTQTIRGPGHLEAHRLVDEGLTHALYLEVVHAEWRVTHCYRLRPARSLVEHSLELTYTGDGEAHLRGLTTRLTLELPAGDGQLLLPGWDGQPAEQPLATLDPQITLTSRDAPFINIGLVGVRPAGNDWNALVWPFSWTDSVDVRVQHTAEGLFVQHQVKVVARLAAGQALRTAVCCVQLSAGPWSAALEEFQDWYRALGVQAPSDRPAWTPHANIYEAHIGTAVFRDGFTYAPFPEMQDLLEHLPRVRALGFDVVQIMPRQPYPCYAVHDYYDISTSYGDAEQLRDLVQVAHGLGLRVILDVLMHGVIDQEIINEVEQSVLTVPDDYWPELRQTVLDFAPYWRAGSLPRHPIAEQHPEWFMRTADGRIASIYTKAFDLANPEMQDYFITAMAHLVRTLDVDGFRFDAPNWNSFPDWNPDRPFRPSFSTFASVQMFDRARQALRQVKSDLLFYTESSGPLFRTALDLNYNYDEQWLIPAVMQGRLTARQMATWFDQRRRALPIGSITAHHVDSHDTFWWAKPGAKWRREQFGLPATQALVAVLALIDGAFMNYAGGEDGQEAHLSRLLHLRRTLPELSARCDYTAVTCSDAHVFTAWRTDGQHHTLIAVNLSDQAVQGTLTWAEGLLPAGLLTWFDALADAPLDQPLPITASALADQPLVLAPYQARVLVLRALPDAAR